MLRPTGAFLIEAFVPDLGRFTYRFEHEARAANALNHPTSANLTASRRTIWWHSMHDASRFIRFGAFQLDPRTGELRKGRTRLRVPNRSIELLKVLLERPGELVTRDELRERLWPVGTFVDFEHGVNTAVRRLRAALGDSADGPRFIETLPRRGYRFVAAVEATSSDGSILNARSHRVVLPCEAVPESALPAAAAPDERRDVPQRVVPPSVPGRTGRHAMALAGAAMLVGITALAAAWRTGHIDPDVAEFPFTALEGDELSGSFSPDGREVVFTWAQPGSRSDIYLKAIDSETVRPFVSTDDSDEVGPVFSPDSRSIAFLRIGADAATLVVKPRDGGAERPITRLTNPHFSFLASPGPHVAWTPDSLGLIYAHQKALHLWRLPDSRSHRLTHPPPTAARGDADPALSPDGRTLVFVRDRSAGSADLYRLALDERFHPRGEPVRLWSNGAWNRSPAWHPDGRRVLFTSGQWGLQRLWYLDLHRPSSAKPLPGLGLDAYQPALSPATGDVLYSRWGFRRQIWMLPLSSAGNAGAPLKPLITSTRADNMPRLARDGSHIVFQSDRSGSFEIWIARADGSELRKVTSFGGAPAGSPDLSPDGRHIVFDRLIDGQRDVFMCDVHGANLRRLTDDPSDDVIPRWSADGQSVYFASYRQGASQIWKLTVDTGHAVRMTTDGGLLAEESPDGQTVYFTGDERSAPVFAMPSGGGEAHPVIESVSFLQMSVTGEGIYYVPAGSQAEVRFLDFSSGAHRQVASLPRMVPGPFAADVNHRMLVFGLAGPPPGDLVLARGVTLP